MFTEVEAVQQYRQAQKQSGSIQNLDKNLYLLKKNLPAHQIFLYELQQVICFNSGKGY